MENEVKISQTQISIQKVHLRHIHLIIIVHSNCKYSILTSRTRTSSSSSLLWKELAIFLQPSTSNNKKTPTFLCICPSTFKKDKVVLQSAPWQCSFWLTFVAEYMLNQYMKIGEVKKKKKDSIRLFLKYFQINFMVQMKER